MNHPPTNGISVADAIAKIFARDGIVPRIVVDPAKGPSWNPKTGIINLPALPSALLNEQQVSQLRAYFWHESHGEQGLNQWHDRPSIAGNKQRFRLANGVGDAFIDLTILKDRPGAGIDIRRAVETDCVDFLAKSDSVKPTVGLASICARYILEGVTTWGDLRSKIPQCAEFFDKIQPVIPDGLRPTSPDHVEALTLALDAALEDYKSGGDPEPQDSEENGSKGPPSPKGEPQEMDGNEVDDLLRPEDADGPESQSVDDSAGDDSADPSESEPTSGDDGDSEADASGGSDRHNGQTQGDNEGDDEVETNGASTGGTHESGAKKAPRELEDGDDSGDRMAKQLANMLRGTEGDSIGTARTFDEKFRTIVTGKDLDRYARDNGRNLTYEHDADAARDAGVLANRLRAALVGPSMKIERGQEYGRFDARRGAMALAGSRTVYTRRREIPGDDVAVSVAWDESGSMSGSKIRAVQAIVERFALALRQLPNVTAEFTGWTDGYGAAELGFKDDRHDCNPITQQENYKTRAGAYFAADNAHGEAMACGSHTAISTAVHRIYKSFDEPAAAVLPRLQHIDARAGTPMSEGFGFSAKRLASRPEQRKVLFFLTDGEAAIEDTAEDTRWGYSALRYEVERAHANGVTVLVFNIGRDFPSQIAKAQRSRGPSFITPLLQRQMQKLQDQFGPHARVIFLDERGNFMQHIFNQLVSLLTRRSRSVAS